MKKIFVVLSLSLTWVLTADSLITEHIQKGNAIFVAKIGKKQFSKSGAIEYSAKISEVFSGNVPKKIVFSGRVGKEPWGCDGACHVRGMKEGEKYLVFTFNPSMLRSVPVDVTDEGWILANVIDETRKVTSPDGRQFLKELRVRGIKQKKK